MSGILTLMARYTETIYPVKKVVNLTAEQSQRIRDYRFEQRLESENEAIRRLIEVGLKASRKKSRVQGKGLPRATLGRGT
jgi:hypothetical protein